MNSIVLLYLDIEDVKEKRVTVKKDSGAGSTKMNMIAKLHNRGIILYFGVPNTTSVTQETNMNYGEFKYRFRKK